MLIHTVIDSDTFLRQIIADLWKKTTLDEAQHLSIFNIFNRYLTEVTVVFKMSSQSSGTTARLS